jgi:hypothetical protein
VPRAIARSKGTRYAFAFNTRGKQGRITARRVGAPWSALAAVRASLRKGNRTSALMHARPCSRKRVHDLKNRHSD